MKTILTVLAASALFASGAALACDDLSHHADAQASKAPETSVVVADKAEAPPPVAKKPVAKQKAAAKPVAQAAAPTRTVAN